MAGIHFSFDNLKQLLDLNIGISDRLDSNRAESFTILYCDFGKVSNELVASSLEQVLRNSDSIVNLKDDYFFLLPYTDRYGADIVRKMFEEFFVQDLNSHSVSYPRDGENPNELLEELQNSVSRIHENDLICLD